MGASAFGVAGGASGCFAKDNTQAAQTPDEGAWNSLADMPFPVQEIYPAEFTQNDREVIVNAGGLIPAPDYADRVTDAVTVYDPTDDNWRLGPSLPAPRHHIALAAHQGALYALTGFARDENGGWQMQSGIWRLDDLDHGQWQARAALPSPQSEPIAASLGEMLHLVCGRIPKGGANKQWQDHTDTGRHWAYDPTNDEWTARAPLPKKRNSAAGAVLDGKLYVISGRTIAGGNTPACDVYDPAADRWSAMAPLPKPIRQNAPRGQGGLAAAVWAGKIYAFGGEWFGAGSGVYADCWAYDPHKDKWRAVAAMARPRHGLGGVALSSGVYAIGGATGPSADGTSPFLDRFVI